MSKDAIRKELLCQEIDKTLGVQHKRTDRKEILKRIIESDKVVPGINEQITYEEKNGTIKRARVVDYQLTDDSIMLIVQPDNKFTNMVRKGFGGMLHSVKLENIK